MDINTIRYELKKRRVTVAADDSLFIYAELNDDVLQSLLNPDRPSNVKMMREKLGANGIRIGEDDPIFKLLAMNSIVLSHAVPKIQWDTIRKWREKNGTQNTRGWQIAAIAASVALFIAVIAQWTTISYVLTGLVGIGLGIGFSVVWIISTKKLKPSRLVQENGVMQPISEHFWNETLFNMIADGLKSKPGAPARRAAKAVLLEQTSVNIAAEKEKMLPEQLSILIAKFNAAR